jgi:hypothetical protein
VISKSEVLEPWDLSQEIDSDGTGNCSLDGLFLKKSLQLIPPWKSSPIRESAKGIPAGSLFAFSIEIHHPQS